MTDGEVAELDLNVQERFRAALAVARRAESLFDLGVARGLIHSLFLDDQISKVQLAKMHARLCIAARPLVEAAPAELRRDYGGDVPVIRPPRV